MDRLVAAIKGETSDRIPVFCNLIDQGVKELGLDSLHDYYQNGEYVAEAQLKMREKYGYDNVWSLFYVGKEAEPDNVVPDIAKHLLKFGATIVGADWGFGFGLNDRLKKLLPSNFNYVTYMHSVIKKFVAWDEAGQRYITNRTEVMTELFNKIKTDIMEFYKWTEFEDIGKDYLNINSEYSDRLRQMKYIHTQPDDAFHSAKWRRIVYSLKFPSLPRLSAANPHTLHSL